MFRKADLALLLLPFAIACSEDAQQTDSGTMAGMDGGIDPKDGSVDPKDGGDPSFAESEKANLRFKEVLRLTNDIAQALELAPAEVCLELGQYDCRFVHNIALGGVEPYELGLVEPTPDTTITTPIAVERLAVHACERRATLDIDSGDAAIFAGIASGQLGAADEANMSAAIDSLYKHAVQRPARATEIEHLMQLYRDIETLGVDDPSRQWAIASCVAVLTSVEALFY